MSRLTFNEWLQTRLNVHGAKLDVDGDIGRRTTNALKSFQRERGLKANGVADSRTVEQLRFAPAASSDRVSVADQPKQTMPPWLAEMNRRMGLHEVRNNSALSRWLRAGKFLGNPAKLPWCGDAVETCIVKTLPDEAVPANPFWAQAWKTFGVDVRDPIVGAIGVIRWSSRAGHVGIVVGYDKRRQRVYLMGGNQQNAVTISSFPLAKFIAFRWPETFPVKHFPALRADNVAQAGFGATR
ncbi:MAG: TIGR02594 family protein [Roseibium sp.]|uniref:NlpC/P60 family protein n=1 Tax=Roseibium sp. TaxID=1936156 RepID=UPI0026113B0B|nr:TIGR02594 family protein [Roseibium sp.]MCV0426193.1 TIGR02594 family protein [Roseibium sp.]